MKLLKTIFDIRQFKTILISLFILFLPFFYTESTLDPVLTIRFLLFSILVFILFLLSLKEKTNDFYLRHPIVKSFITLFFIFLFSATFNDSIISEAIYSTLKLALFVIFLTILSGALKDASNRKKIFLSVGLFSLISSALYIYQIIGLKINNIQYKNFEALASTFANKNLLASILFLSIPFNVYNAKSKNIIKKTISFLALFLMLLVFYFTMSKAVIIALLILFFSVFILKFTPEKFSKFFSLSLVCTLLFLCFTLIHLSNSQNVYSEKIKQKLIYLTQNKALFLDKKASFGTRLNLYKNTFDLIKNNPVLGVGPGNWKIQHGKYSLYGTLGENGRKLVQRPHSDLLWIASEAGIIAGIVYLLIFIIALQHIHKKVFIDSKNQTLFNYSIIGVVLGYFFISLFDFPSERVAHNIMFVLILSYIISINHKKPQKKLNNNFRNFLCFIVFLIICSTIYIADVRHRGETYLTKAKFYKGKNSWRIIVKNVDKAYIPNIYEIDRSGTPIHWHRGVANFSMGKIEDSFLDFKLAYSFNPYHLHVLNNIGTIYEIKGNSEVAKNYYKKALLISPRFEEASVNLAAILFNENKIQESLDVILRCNIPQDYLKYERYLKTIAVNLIYTYLKEKKTNIADIKKIRDLKKLFEVDNKVAIKIMRELYEKRKNNGNHYLDLYLNKKAT